MAEPSRPRAEGANDHPAIVDRMGFKPYVDALALVLSSEATAPPFTVSLEGEWGSGKSSFVLQLKESIESLYKKRIAAEKAKPTEDRAEAQPPRFVNFNAWQHDKDEALWASFALEFARQVTAPLSWLARVRMESALLWQRADKRVVLTWAGACVALVIAIGSILVKRVFFPDLYRDEPSELMRWVAYLKVAVPLALASSVVVVLGQALLLVLRAPLNNLKKFVEKPDYRARLGFLERFHDDFAKAVATYTANARTFVFVDDLDRCEVPKAVELLQALNLLLAGDLPLVVVLAMDRPKIAAGVAARNKELLAFLPQPAVSGTKLDANDGVGIAYGYEFVEKFVQLSLRIPRLGADTTSSFLDSLVFPQKEATVQSTTPASAEPEDPVTSDGSEVRRMLDLVAPTLGFNPRRIKQFLNLFRVRYFIASKTGQLRHQQNTGGWTISQLGKIVAIEIVWPRLLDELLAAPHTLAELHDVSQGPTKPEDGSLGARWRDDQALMELLRRPPGGDANEYGLREVRDLLPCLYGAGAPKEETGTLPS